MFAMKNTTRIALGLAASALFAFAPAVLAAPSNVSAEDQDKEWMAPNLAERHGLFADARAMASSITDPVVKSITLAKVAMAESKTVDADSRGKLQKEAQDLLRDRTEDSARLAYCEILLDVADGNGPKESDKDSILQARDRLQALRADMDKRRLAAFNFFALNAPNDNYVTFMGSYYQEARAMYLLAKAEPPRSKERSQRVEQVAAVIQDMGFEQIHWTRSEFDAYILNGDAKLVEGEYVAAVDRYLELPAALSQLDRSHPLVREQSLRGYLKAMETLTTALSNDPKSAERIRREVANAFATFPGARNTPQGKELIIYDTGASIRLGGNPATALATLNTLVGDSDPGLRRKAARQLAELAGNPALSNAQRLDCAKKVVSVAEYEVMLLAIQSLQSLLAGISTPQDFEAYGPYCYSLIGMTYERMHRFQDAAVVLREGANRFRYLRDNNPSWDSGTDDLPKHFFDPSGQPNCDAELGNFKVRLKTTGDAFDFPRILAARALDNARYMASRASGDETNADFSAFAKELDEWYVPFAGEEQRFRVVKQRGYERFQEGKTNALARIESATYLLSTPVADSGATNAYYFAGTAIVLATSASATIPNVPQNFADNVSRDAFFLGGYTLLGLKFDSQLARVDSDFERLPASLRQELKDLINQLAGPSAVTDAGKYWWLYSQYALKRALMVQINTDAARVSAAATDGKKLSISEAFDAFCDGANAAFLRLAPEDRQAKPSMVLSAKVILQLVYAINTPKLNITDPAQKRQDEAALIANSRTEVRELLRTAWRNLTPHIEASLNGAEGKDKADLDTVLRTMVTGLFREMVDAGRPTEANEAFEAYRLRYAADNPDPTSDAGKTLRSMAGELYNTLLRVERPRADVLRTAAERLQVIGVQLGKPELIDLFAAADYFKSSGQQAKVADYNNLTSERRTELVLEAWNKLDSSARREATGEYLRGRVLNEVFGNKASIKFRTGTTETELPFAGVIPATELSQFNEFWDASKPRYAAMLNDGALRALNARRADATALLTAQAVDDKGEAKPVDPAVKALADAAIKVIDDAIADVKAGKVDAALKRLDDAIRPNRANDPADKDRKAPAAAYGESGVTVINGARLGLANAMRDLEWGSGHAFRAELRYYLESRGDSLRGDARVPMRRFLDGNARLRAIQGEPLYTPANADAMGELFSAVGDWDVAVGAWQAFFKNREALYADSSYIRVVADRRQHTHDPEIAEEVRVRLELARALFEVGKNEKSAQKRLDLLNEALHHARRVYAVMQWRDGVESDKDTQWKRNLATSELGRQIERSYIPALRLYSEILETFADAGLRPKWQAKYYAQSFGALTKEAVDALDEKQRFFKLPEDTPSLYSEAAMCQYMLRSFGEMPGGFYNVFYREAFPKWGQLKIKEAGAHTRAGKKDLADAAAGMVARFIWSEWNNKKDIALDDASKAYIATLRTVFEDARKVVSLSWMQANAQNVLDAELAASKATGGGK